MVYKNLKLKEIRKLANLLYKKNFFCVSITKTLALDRKPLHRLSNDACHRKQWRWLAGIVGRDSADPAL